MVEGIEFVEMFNNYWISEWHEHQKYSIQLLYGKSLEENSMMQKKVEASDSFVEASDS